MTLLNAAQLAQLRTLCTINTSTHLRDARETLKRATALCELNLKRLSNEQLADLYGAAVCEIEDRGSTVEEESTEPQPEPVEEEPVEMPPPNADPVRDAALGTEPTA